MRGQYARSSADSVNILEDTKQGQTFEQRDIFGRRHSRAGASGESGNQQGLSARSIGSIREGVLDCWKLMHTIILDSVHDRLSR